MVKKGKGWTLAGEYPTKRLALERAIGLRPKFYQVNVQKGTKGAAYFRAKEIYRVWVK